MRAKGPSPYFQFPGTARAALERWSEVFGGQVRIATYRDLSRIDGPPDAVAHGQLAGDLELFAADTAEGEESFSSSGLLFSLLGAADPETLTRWFEALSVDGTVLDPLQRRPWGDWDGQVRDAFGVTWLIGYKASAVADTGAGAEASSGSDTDA
ncbi:VOC family protein [Curtobacterium luteum]|uniref:VOC family protein n=1 Tax=Curtobacterium luteum TaxID=33881 RepID=UPI003826A3C4